LEERFYDDLLVVLILTLITVSCLLIPGSNLTAPFIYIPYILLLLFLPGYSLIAAYNPEFANYSLLKRVVLSIGLSLVFSIFIALLLTYTPLKIINGIIVYFIGAFTIILSLVAIMKRKNYHYVHFIEPLGEPTPVGQHTYKELLEPTEILVERVEHPPEEEYNQESSHDEPDKQEIEEPDKREVKESRTNEKVTKNPMPQRRPPNKFAYLDLILVLLLTIACSVIIFTPGLNATIYDGVTVNNIVGLFLMLFLPGYALVSAISTRKTDLNIATRLVLSFGISYFLTTVIGLILTYTSMGSSLEPILQVLSVLTLIFILTAFVMRMRTPQENRFGAGFTRSPNSKGTSPQGGSPTTPPPKGSHRTRNIMLVSVVVIIALLITAPTAYNFMNPGEKSTEFYIIGPDGQNITNYPSNLTPGETGTVTIVLVNHENQETSYRILATSNGTTIGEINATLKPDEKKEIPYNFTVGNPGTKKLEFQLFKLPDIDTAYNSYSFWITILEIVTNETVTSETSTSTTPTYQTPVYQPPVNQQPAEPVYDEFQSEY